MSVRCLDRLSRPPDLCRDKVRQSTHKLCSCCTMPPASRSAFRLLTVSSLAHSTLRSLHPTSTVLAACSRPTAPVIAKLAKRTMSNSAAPASSSTSPSTGTIPDTKPAPSLRQAKKSLRKSMGQTLRSMTPTEIIEQSERVTKLVLRSRAWNEAQSISIYVSMAGGEVVTDTLCREALRQGTSWISLSYCDLDARGQQGWEG